MSAEHEMRTSPEVAAELERLRARVTELEGVVRRLNTQRGDAAQLVERERRSGEECVDIGDVVAALSLGSDEVTGPGPSVEGSADALTRLFAPVQALREDANAAPCCHLHKPSCCDPEDCGPCCMDCPTCPTLAKRRADGWCTGCVTDHSSDECGYRPESGGGGRV